MTTTTTAASLLHSGAYRRYQAMAWVTGILLAFMTLVGLPYKYVLGHHDALWYQVGWQFHGFFYMVYLVTVLDVAIRARWTPGRTVLVALAGTIPFLSFVFERRITHQQQRAEQQGGAGAGSPRATAPGRTT